MSVEFPAGEHTRLTHHVTYKSQHGSLYLTNKRVVFHGTAQTGKAARTFGFPLSRITNHMISGAKTSRALLKISIQIKGKEKNLVFDFGPFEEFEDIVKVKLERGTEIAATQSNNTAAIAAKEARDSWSATLSHVRLHPTPVETQTTDTSSAQQQKTAQQSSDGVQEKERKTESTPVAQENKSSPASSTATHVPTTETTPSNVDINNIRPLRRKIGTHTHTYTHSEHGQHVVTLFQAKLRASLLVRDAELKQLHTKLVKGDIISEQEFWKSRSNMLLNESQRLNNQQRGVSSALVTDVRPSLDRCNRVHYRIDATIMHQIFLHYPAVQAAYIANVPDKLTETEFWTKYFQSRYFHRSRTDGDTELMAKSTDSDKIANNDSFFARYDEKLQQQNAARQTSQKRRRKTHVIVRKKLIVRDPTIDLTSSELSLAFIGDHTNTHQSRSQLRTAQFMRKFNRHGELVLESAQLDHSHASSYEQAMNEALDLDELKQQEEEHKFDLKIQNQDQYFQSRLRKTDSEQPRDAQQNKSDVKYEERTQHLFAEELLSWYRTRVQCHQSERKTSKKRKSRDINHDNGGKKKKHKRLHQKNNTAIVPVNNSSSRESANGIESGIFNADRDVLIQMTKDAAAIEYIMENTSNDDYLRSSLEPNTDIVFRVSNEGTSVSATLCPYSLLFYIQLIVSKHQLDGIVFKHTIPAQFQKDLKTIFSTCAELIRHFWACFPIQSHSIRDKLLRIVNSLNQMYSSIQGLKKSLHSHQQSHLAVLFNSVMAMLDKAFEKYERNKGKGFLKLKAKRRIKKLKHTQIS